MMTCSRFGPTSSEEKLHARALEILRDSEKQSPFGVSAAFLAASLLGSDRLARALSANLNRED